MVTDVSKMEKALQRLQRHSVGTLEEFNEQRGLQSTWSPEVRTLYQSRRWSQSVREIMPRSRSRYRSPIASPRSRLASLLRAWREVHRCQAAQGGAFL